MKCIGCGGTRVRVQLRIIPHCVNSVKVNWLKCTLWRGNGIQSEPNAPREMTNIFMSQTNSNYVVQDFDRVSPMPFNCVHIKASPFCSLAFALITFTSHRHSISVYWSTVIGQRRFLSRMTWNGIPYSVWQIHSNYVNSEREIQKTKKKYMRSPPCPVHVTMSNSPDVPIPWDFRFVGRRLPIYIRTCANERNSISMWMRLQNESAESHAATHQGVNALTVIVW